MDGLGVCSLNLLRVAKLLASHPSKMRSGYEVMKLLGMKRSTAYYVLGQLERGEWATSYMERSGRLDSSGPPRRLYRITGEGHQNVNMALAMLQMTSTATAVST